MNTHSFPLLSTKLHRPPVTGETVCRKRLHEVMDRALELPLTVVSAPAGYGKSTLVSHWAESLDEPCAWLSLDSGDSDLEVFVSYLLAAIETVVRRCVPRDPGPDHGAQPGSARWRCWVAAWSTNWMPSIHRWCWSWTTTTASSRRSSVHEFLWFLLEHPPRSLRLVLATRCDPPFSIGSLRGRGGLTEVRLRDLRFTAFRNG